MITNAEPTFLDLVITGHSDPDTIDDFIDEWHSGGSNQPLFTRLGMTRDEYIAWAKDPGVLPAIVDAYRARQR